MANEESAANQVQIHNYLQTIGHVGPLDINASWSNYQERLEFFFEANNVTDENKKRAMLLAQFGEAAYEILRSLVTPQTPKDFTYTQIINKLQGHFNPTPNEIVERFNFNRRIQKEDESIADFVADLRKLSKFCNFTELNKMLRDRIVCGVADEGLQKKLFSEPNLTFERALELAIAAEAARKNVEDVRNVAGNSISKISKNKNDQEVNPTKTFNPCYHCGEMHDGKNCKFKEAECHYCRKKGHIVKVCFKKKNENQGQRTQSNSKSVNCNAVEDECNFYILNAIHAVEEQEKIVANLKLNDIGVKMEVDSGAVCTIIKKQTWEKIRQGNEILQKSPLSLQTWTQQKIDILGETVVKVQYQQITKYLKAVVSEGGGWDLLGRNWFRELGISVQGVHHVDSKTQALQPNHLPLFQQYPTVFQEKLGMFVADPVKLELKEDAKPIFLKSRQVPFALKPAVERELEKLIQQEVMEPTDYSEWATPLVTQRKSDGKIRLCGDYRSTVNPALKKNSYPLPTITEMITLLTPATVFSTLDLSQAYQQVRVDDETAKILTLNTHRGLFKVKRLPFGASVCPGIFQRIMDSLLASIPGAKAYLDDIIVFGRNEDEHEANLRRVLDKLREAGLTLKKDKCKIRLKEIKFLGFLIGEQGVRPTEDRVKAIKHAPRPTNKEELQSFLGMVNFYNRFLKDKSTIIEPLNRLLEDKPWKWTAIHENSFSKLKELMSSEVILVHYDEAKELVLNCDASPYGIGVVLAHREGNVEKPIAYWSRTLGKHERNYAQIDREALAVVEGVQQFHQYVAGRKFTITTDHRPLLGLLSVKKPIPAVLSPRMLRWCLILSAYDYNLEYRKGKENGNADCLSRLPMTSDKDELTPPGDILLLESEKRPIPIEDIREYTTKDEILSKVRYWTWHQWPTTELPEEYKPFQRKKMEISVHKDCLLWGNRLIAPKVTRERFLELLHANHPGIVAMKACARSYVWWPNIDQDIENCVNQCKTCQIHANNPPKAPRQNIEKI